MLLIKNQKEITIKKIKLGHKRLILDIFFLRFWLLFSFLSKGHLSFPNNCLQRRNLVGNTKDHLQNIIRLLAFDFHNWLMAQWRRLSWILQKRLWKQRRDRSPQQNTKGWNKHGRSPRPPVVEGRSDAYGTVVLWAPTWSCQSLASKCFFLVQSSPSAPVARGTLVPSASATRPWRLEVGAEKQKWDRVMGTPLPGIGRPQPPQSSCVLPVTSRS